MTNPTYTDEQVLKCAKTYEGYGEPVCPAMLRSLLADRQRLQAEVEALRPDAECYRWLRDQQDGDCNSRSVYVVFNRDEDSLMAYADTFDHHIDAARATPNETKEAKS